MPRANNNKRGNTPSRTQAKSNDKRKKRKKRSPDCVADGSEFACIDLTEDGDDDIDDLRRVLVPKSGGKKRAAIDEVIVLDSSDDENDPPASYAKTTKSNSADERTQTAEVSRVSKKARVKKEGQTSPSSARPNNDLATMYDDVEIVQAEAPKFTRAADSVSRKASEGGGNTGDNEDDVVVEGVLNETRLPHMRQHCTSFPFRTTRSRKLSVSVRRDNQQSCDLCYCYVCDCPVKDCKNWHSSSSTTPKNNHCCATEKDRIWEDMRLRSKVTDERAEDEPPEGFHFMKDCDRLACDKCWCYVCDKPGIDCTNFEHVAANPEEECYRRERQKRKLSTYGRPGPFEPTNPDAPRDIDLTKCRHCSWFVRLRPDRGVTPSSDDWCKYCGRVASDEDLEKNQKAATSTEEKNSYFFGQKEIPFRIKAHDPRLLDEYKVNWEDNDGKAEWHYDEAERQEEVFLHRIGRSPNLQNIYTSIQRVAEENIPNKPIGQSHKRMDDTDAIIVGDPKQLQLLYLIVEKKIDGLEINASWCKESKIGRFTLRFMLPKCFMVEHPVSNKHSALQRYLPHLLGLWFGMFPFQVSELCGILKASNSSYRYITKKLRNQYKQRNQHKKSLPRKEIKEIDNNLFPILRKKLESFSVKMREDEIAKESKLTLAPSNASKFSGSVCTSAPSGSSCSDLFRNSLVRYFSELFVKHMASSYNVDSDSVEGICQGSMFRTKSNFFDFVLGFQSNVVTELCYYRDARKQIRERPSEFSIKQTLTQLENLGHETEDCVEGLTIELLDFQRQSLKWALERERILGGIQSYHWVKVPNRGEGHEDELYFNPLLRQFRKDKPKVIRGGFIADQMGLGKTVISLSLILKNPAPEIPSSGSPISVLKKKSHTVLSPNIATPGNYDWDENLYEKTSTSNKKKGSIICRGTLVICPVSLVGQWIAEAKSKLKEPGLIYPYHGSNRKRDPKILTKNSIVVTTYDVIQSDAFYHKEKSHVKDYCSPLEQIRWWRIICDEGHCLRHASSMRSKAVRSLVSDHKWIVSGTPMNTSPDDLKNQLKFLGFENVQKSFDELRHSVDKKRFNMDLLTHFLRPIMIHHNQEQTYRGTSTTLMSLPPKTEKRKLIRLTTEEKKELQEIEKKTQEWYLKFRSIHFKTMSKHFLKISSRLTPMRIACSGGEYPIFSESEHVGADADDHENVEYNNSNNTASGDIVRSKFVFQSKFKYLLSELEEIKANERDSKSLVFSQFSSTLEWLKIELPKHGFQFRTLSGDMSMQKRAKALADFQNDPPTTIFLLSMRAGAVGINLTQANRVFLMEPSFNPALEAQAIGRIHRLGQKRAVEVVRLVVQDSFEERMINFLDRKYSRCPNDEKKENSNKKAFATKDYDGIAGNVNADKTTLLTAEFDVLFDVGSYQPERKTSGKDAVVDGDVDPSADENISKGIV